MSTIITQSQQDAPRKQKDIGIGPIFHHASYGEFAEHGNLGDAILLKWTGDTVFLASNKKLNMPNTLSLTYGQINSLAGDFYGTYDAISDGKTFDEQVKLFLKAWHWIGLDTTRQPNEANDLIAAAAVETKAAENALRNHKDPSVAYSTLPDLTAKFELITFSRSFDVPGYLGLAKINFDHFGEDARKAYNAGHYAAMQVAIGGKPEDLELAYAMNAHADHFLEDSFSAGHMRTPRRVLHNWSNLADLCCKYMHDEDSAIGLVVTNPNGDKPWRAYGDKRMLDKEDDLNKGHCIDALQTSVDEIHDAWTSGKLIDPSAFKAWKHAPTLESAHGPQDLAPLFNQKGERRSEIDDRRTWKFTNNYTYAGTALDLAKSDLWKYPIHM